MRLDIFRLCLLFGFYSFCVSAYSQSAQERQYYVVIGTHRTLQDAEKQTDEATSKGFTAQYAISDGLFYHVFLLQTPDKAKARQFLKKIRKETVYKDAWLVKGKLGV